MNITFMSLTAENLKMKKMKNKNNANIFEFMKESLQPLILPRTIKTNVFTIIMKQKSST